MSRPDAGEVPSSPARSIATAPPLDAVTKGHRKGTTSTWWTSRKSQMPSAASPSGRSTAWALCGLGVVSPGAISSMHAGARFEKANALLTGLQSSGDTVH